MKKTILLSSILAVGAAFADATVNSTEIGVMGVDTPTSAANLIAVPFLGYEADNITVKDMVNTPELEENTELYVPNASGTYDVWTLDKDKKWANTQSNVVIGNGGATESSGPDAAGVTTARGSAFWLKPPAGAKSETTKTCYLLGKPGSAAGSSALVSDKWNLVGNTAGVTNDVPVGKEGEKVCVPNAAGGLTTYTVRSGGWLNGRNPKCTVAIQPGQGFWYLSKGTSSISWGND